MATTRTPLQPATTHRACHAVGFEAYIVLYRDGQEDLARESIYRFARNPDLAFSWADASAMGEQIPATPLTCDPHCNCDACVAERNRERVAGLENLNERLRNDLETAKAIIGLGMSGVAICILVRWAGGW